MNNSKQKILLACAISAALATTTHAQTVPTATSHSDYTGDSFVAHWQAVDDAQGYRLSVFGQGETRNVCQTFDAIRHNDGKIDTDEPNYPDGWDVSVSQYGDTDMANDGERDKVVLDATGDYIATKRIIGSNVANYAVGASLINAEGITQDNSSVFVVDFYGQDGQRITGGEIESMYFATRPQLSLLEALGYNPANVASIKIGLRKDDTRCVGDIMIDSISYDYDAPAYVLSDYATQDTSTLVDGLDAEDVYWYYVKSENAQGLSDCSNIVRVDGFLTPKAMEASDITSTSYTAHWQRLPKATGYIVQNYKMSSVAAGTTYDVLRETFSGATEGTVDSPTTVTDADQYADNKGWTGRNLLAAEGMMGADAGRFPMNLSYVHSPELNLAGEGGKYTVTLKAHGTTGDYLSVYRVDYLVDNDGDGTPESLNIHKTTTFDDNGDTEDTWEMTDGADGMVLSFEENKMRKFFIDEITITQTATTDHNVSQRMEKATLDNGETTEYTFANLEADAQYGYDVTAVRTNQYGDEELSDVSDIIVVQLPTSVNVATAATPRVRTSGKTLTLTLGHADAIALYRINGSTVKVAAGHAGDNTITLPGSGAYILKVGQDTYKVIAR